MWDAFLAGDAEAAHAAFHPDVEWDGRNLPDGSIGRGHQAILDHVARWSEMWDEWEVTESRFAYLGGGRVAVLFRERGRSKASLAVDEEHAELYEVREGLIVRRTASTAARAEIREVEQED